MGVVASADFCKWVHNIGAMLLIFLNDSKSKSCHLVNPVAGVALSIRLITKIASNDNQIKSVSQAVNIIALKLEPAEASFFGYIKRLRVFEHDSFFVAVDTGAELLENVVKLRDDFVLDNLESTWDSFESVL